ncbi:hypothetical protein FRACYDRAFT_258447 [Fragilariopsis cylindrus CCMP1102]|uniref:Uncharacterized protein n=1 Tax=Fragilariopsis cylindrus CCMP1102 TaxID=635003 RepID=A0A1E7EIM5_9STRA|nr:hypothetical protein FRACYDRAFT_258447 [Fragilariopsis cylindrus CCMP1102]|eukprot:OEU05744.1 hypothetical protein FRACYDRAFT_258447 [Fragilariopsis cylindrus CCMP1102]
MNCNSDTHPAPPVSPETDDDTTEKLAGEDITEESIEVEKPKKRVFIVSKVETNTNSDDNNSHQYPSAEQPLEASSDSCGQKTQTAEALLSSEATVSLTEISEDQISEEPQNLGDDPPVAICTTTTSTNAGKSNKVNGDSNANHTTTTSNISGLSNTSRPKPLDKNSSSRALSTPVSTFDTGSIGSLPSALDSSVGRSDAPKNRMEKDDPSLIETRSLPINISASTAYRNISCTKNRIVFRVRTMHKPERNFRNRNSAAAAAAATATVG